MLLRSKCWRVVRRSNGRRWHMFLFTQPHLHTTSETKRHALATLSRARGAARWRRFGGHRHDLRQTLSDMLGLAGDLPQAPWRWAGADHVSSELGIFLRGTGGSGVEVLEPLAPSNCQGSGQALAEPVKGERRVPGQAELLAQARTLLPEAKARTPSAATPLCSLVQAPPINVILKCSVCKSKFAAHSILFAWSSSKASWMAMSLRPRTFGSGGMLAWEEDPPPRFSRPSER